MLRIHTFGSCYLERDGMRMDALSGQRKGLALLALLGTVNERGISRDGVLAYLWPESDEERARTSLKQLVHSLRTQLRAPELLLGVAELRLNPAIATSDVAEFRAALRLGDHATAVALYDGPFLDGFFLKDADGFERWQATERGSLAHDYARVVEALAEEAAAGGNLYAAVNWWRKLASAEPLSARAATSLISALDAAGERAAALKHARVYEMLVRQEVGSAPDPSVTALVSRLKHEVATTAEAPAVTPVADAPISSEPAFLQKPSDAGASSNDIKSLSVSERLPAVRSGARRGRRWLDWREPMLVLAAVIVIFSGLRAAWQSRLPVRATAPSGSGSAATRASVAVLPFVNTSGNPADEPFTDGLTDEVIATLSQVNALKVAGRTSAFALKGKNLSVRAIADTLGVATVLEGGVRRARNRFKISVQLVNASDNTVLWAETYDREVRDVFVLQEDIARAIVGALRVRFTGPGEAVLARQSTGDPGAYELYLRGRYVMNTQIGREGVLDAARHFEQAVARDSTYARAYAGLSDAHARLAIFGYGRPQSQMARARAFAMRALALDSSLAEAHASLAHILFVHDFDWVGSEREFRRAIALDPRYVFARQTFAMRLASEARFDEAAAQADTALTVDPLAATVINVLARVHVSARKPDLALPKLRQALALNPHLDLAYQQLGHAYLQKGMKHEAIVALRRAAELSGPRDSAQLAYAYATTGNRGEALQIVAALLDPSERRYLPPYHIAMAYAGLGDRDKAFRWLERGYTERASFMGGVKVEPGFESLHADPRWTRFMRRMGLSPEPWPPRRRPLAPRASAATPPS